MNWDRSAGRLSPTMNLSNLVFALVGLVAFSSACSSDSGGRRPLSAAAGGSASGGKAAGGTGGVVVLGSGGSGGALTGGTSSGGSSTGGTGGGSTALDLSNCDTATLTALFNKRHCDDCHFGPISFHLPASLEGWINTPGKKQATIDCPTRTVVVPGSTETSLLYIKLSGTPPAGCGVQMPEPERATDVLVPFTTEELKCVADWINGLPSNGTGGKGGASN